MTNRNIIGVIAVVALIIAIIGNFTPAGQKVASKLRGVTNYDEVDTTALKVGGTNGSRVGPIITNTCSAGLIGFDTSQAASTTRPYDCAVTGVVSGDLVFVASASTTSNSPAGPSGWFITAAKASTTSGFITLGVTNFSGTAGIPSAPANAGGVIGSSTQFIILHPLTSVPGL